MSTKEKKTRAERQCEVKEKDKRIIQQKESQRSKTSRTEEHSSRGKVALLAVVVLKAKPTCPTVMNWSCQDKPNKQRSV